MPATKNPLVRLGHMRDEIASITAELKNVDRSGFSRNYLLLRAAERALLIISEAAKALPWISSRVTPRSIGEAFVD
jgi:uncharacterized protein with HEPN domain